MSRNLLIVLVVAVLLATPIAAATATPLKVDRVATVEATARLGPGNGPSHLLRVIQPEGGSECGGAGGCPV